MDLPQVLDVLEWPGVASVLLTDVGYGTLFLKPTIILHNLPKWQALAKPPLPWKEDPQLS